MTLLRTFSAARPDLTLFASCGTDPAPACADGRHIPEAQWRRNSRLALYGRGGPVSASAHSLAAARRAVARGADIVFLSPVFDTASHPAAQPLGVARFFRISQLCGGRVVALGGVSAGQAWRICRLGAFGAAGIGLFRS